MPSRIIQKYIVLLGERDGNQIWLAYNDFGRIGNASYDLAFHYDTWAEAADALRRVRYSGNRWGDAKILGTTVKEEIPHDKTQ